MLNVLDHLVREAGGHSVRLDAYPPVYEGADGVSLDPVGPEVLDPDEDLILCLLHLHYPGVLFDLPDDVPGFRDADPVPIYAGAGPDV